MSDYGARWYDAVVGRFWGVDPIASDFAHVTPYNYAENEPVGHIDLWGLQGLSMQHLWQAMGLNSSGNMNYIRDKASLIVPSYETQDRAGKIMNGSKNLFMGIITTAGALEAAPLSGGYSATALPFTFGEIGIGGTQIYDGIFGEYMPWEDNPLHQGSSLPGILAYKNDGPYAELIDATGQFLPGIVSGGNLVGAARSVQEISVGIRSADALKVTQSSLNLIEAVGDVTGVIDATTNLKNSNSQKLDNAPANLNKYYQIQVKKSDIIFSTKEVDDFKKFLDQHQNPK